MAPSAPEKEGPEAPGRAPSVFREGGTLRAFVDPTAPRGGPAVDLGSARWYLEDDGRERRLVGPILVGFGLGLSYPVLLVCF